MSEVARSALPSCREVILASLAEQDMWARHVALKNGDRIIFFLGKPTVPRAIDGNNFLQKRMDLVAKQMLGLFKYREGAKAERLYESQHLR
jgi:hypothetical protein